MAQNPGPPPTAARGFWLVSYGVVVTMMGTTLPTPLYPIYQQRLGFTQLTITVIFAVYAIGVLAGLLLFGKLSDDLGRRAVLLPGLGLGVLSAVMFLVWPTLTGLLVGRVLSGLSAGIVIGTATAALVDLASPERRGFATRVAVVVNLGGLGAGALLAGLLAGFAPDALQLPYAVNVIMLIIAGAGLLWVPETVAGQGGWRVTVQRLGVPASVREVFIPAATGGFCGFAVSGLFGAVSPDLLVSVLHMTSHAIAGSIVALVFATSAAGQVVVGRLPDRRALPLGCAALAAGVALVGVAVGEASLAALLAAAAVGGIGQGLTIGAGLVALNARTPTGRRSEVASSFFFVIYLGLVVPVVGVGVVTHEVGLRKAGVAFSAVIGVIVLAVLASLLLRPDGPGGGSGEGHPPTPSRLSSL